MQQSAALQCIGWQYCSRARLHCKKGLYLTAAQSLTSTTSCCIHCCCCHAGSSPSSATTQVRYINCCAAWSPSCWTTTVVTGAKLTAVCYCSHFRLRPGDGGALKGFPAHSAACTKESDTVAQVTPSCIMAPLLLPRLQDAAGLSITPSQTSAW